MKTVFEELPNIHYIPFDRPATPLLKSKRNHGGFSSFKGERWNLTPAERKMGMCWEEKK